MITFLLSNEKKKHVIWLICLGVGGQEWDGNIDKNKAEQIFVMLLVTLGLHCPRTSVGKSLAMEFVTMFQSSIQCKAKTGLWVRQFHWVFVNPKLIVLWKCTKVTLWNNELQNLANYSFHKCYMCTMFCEKQREGKKERRGFSSTILCAKTLLFSS